MVVWTPAEEQKLAELQNKKKKVQEFQMGRVEALVSSIHYPNMTKDDLVEALIEKASAVTDVLTPWTFAIKTHTHT